MTYDPSHLPDDPSRLKEIVVALLESDAARQKAFDEMVAEIAKLNVTIQKLTEMLFGKKNNKLVNLPVPEEPPKFETEKPAKTPENPASEPLAGTPRKKTKNGGGGRMKIPDDIPVRIVENYRRSKSEPVRNARGRSR